MKCLLCQNPAIEFSDGAYQCQQCHLVFKNPKVHLSAQEDLKRYLNHQNSNEDEGYKNFLKRLTNPLEKFLPEKFMALDFGCGPGPTICHILKETGGLVFNFDPIFYNDVSLLTTKYDVVTATEVVEHFKEPLKDWEKLIETLKPGALLGIMTQFLNNKIDYSSWWYKNDPTHVVFYRLETFQFLADQFNLEALFHDNNSVIIFRKK